jgi:hypothetical protein
MMVSTIIRSRLPAASKRQMNQWLQRVCVQLLDAFNNASEAACWQREGGGGEMLKIRRKEMGWAVVRRN